MYYKLCNIKRKYCCTSIFLLLIKHVLLNVLTDLLFYFWNSFWIIEIVSELGSVEFWDLVEGWIYIWVCKFFYYYFYHCCYSFWNWRCFKICIYVFINHLVYHFPEPPSSYVNYLLSGRIWIIFVLWKWKLVRN